MATDERAETGAEATAGKGPRQLFRADGQPYGWMCGVCEAPWRDSHFGAYALHKAAACCSPTCDTCGKPMDKRSWCGPCADKRARDREEAIFAKATKLTWEEYCSQPGEPMLFFDGNDHMGNQGYVSHDEVEEELRASP